MIPYGRQNITESDIEAVVSALTSDYLTQGPKVEEFERALSNYCKVEHAVAVNSATSALHLACLALGVGVGDYVWTSPITFVASANCARYCGAEVDFVDIDPLTFNMCPVRLAEKLALAEQQGKLPKVVIPVHLCGQSCDMQVIHALSKQYGFRIIEDASHAVGGRYNEKPVGSCEFSDIAIFSFHPVKIITAGEGGMALTNDDDLAALMLRLRTHGIVRDNNLMKNCSHGSWYYEQLELGYNYRLTDIHAALGLSQLSRLDAIVERRQQIKQRYDELLSDLPVYTQQICARSRSSLHLYVIRLREESNFHHKTVFEQLRMKGVGVNLHYIPVYRHPYYAKCGIKPSNYPCAEAYYNTAITIPLFPELTIAQQDYVVDSLKQVLYKAGSLYTGVV